MSTEINALKSVKNNFKKGYEMLPAKYQIEVRNEIMEECGWTLTTFHNKRCNRRRIFKLEIPVIEKHFAKHNINPWTGEKLIT